MSIERALPHDPLAERAILGSIVLDNLVLTVLAGKLAPGDFFLPPNRKIFSAMLDLAKQSQPINAVTLCDVLGSNVEPGYISQLADKLEMPLVKGPADIESYASVVKRDAALRQVIWTADAIKEAAFSRDITSAERAKKEFGEIGIAREPVRIYDTPEEFRSSKPLRSLIENMFQADVVNMVGGLSGDGKTLILFSITKALLTGRPLFGHFKVTEPVDRVIYLIPECARPPFYHRAKLFGLVPFIDNERLLVRTLSKGPLVPLSDPQILRDAPGSVIHIDTAIRFSSGDEKEALDVSNGLAKDAFGLIGAGAIAVGAAHHSPKGFAKEHYITLENVLRGSGDFGGFVGAGIGIRQVDPMQNIIYIQDIKSRESEPFPPFQIIGRPFINDEGDFRIYRAPGDCGPLADYLDIPGRNKGGASVKDRDNKASNLEHLRTWLNEDSKQTSAQLALRFKSIDVKVSPETVRGYKRQLNNDGE